MNNANRKDWQASAGHHRSGRIFYIEYTRDHFNFAWLMRGGLSFRSDEQGDGDESFYAQPTAYSGDLCTTQSEAGRYGIQSMELLINEMLKRGGEKRFFKAKAFGGATLIGNGRTDNSFLNIGEVNITFIREFLKRERIPLVAENLGGKAGRMIHFSYGDFAVYMRRIKSADKSKRIAVRDRECWQHAIAEQEKHEVMIRNVELWI